MHEPPASSSWQLSIRWILPAAVVLPAFAVALLLTLLAYKSGQQVSGELAAQSVRQIHERIENHLDHLMNLPPAINRLNELRLRDGTLALDDPGRNRLEVFQTLQIFPDVSDIVLGSAQGQAMWIIRYPGEITYEYAIKRTPDSPMQEFAMGSDGRIGQAPLRSYRFDAVGRPWYRAAIEADGPTWGKVYVWVRGGTGATLGVSYVEPYRDDRAKILGVISCELSLADISAFLKRLQIGKTGMAFIMERDGNLIATSVGLSCMKDGLVRLPATEAPDPRIVTAARSLAAQPGGLAAIGAMQIRGVNINGRRTLMAVSPFHNRNLEWLVVTLVPDSDFLADIQRARTRHLWIGGAAVLLALAIGIVMAMWLLNPILAVVAHARRVGAGALDERIHRRDNREIADLSAALNEMTDGLQDRMRLRHSLDLAMEVQQSLLPTQTPRIKGLDVAARSKYCDQTGGDYYDYLSVEGMGPHSLMVALGDVAGHGIAAAMLMATARAVLRSQAPSQNSLGHLLNHVNQHLVADTRGDRFMTLFLGIIDASALSMRWASAGHDQPFIFDPQSGLLTEIDPGGGGLPLGILKSETYDEQSYDQLRPGQVMLIGTDGLWEARNGDGEQFGKARVGQAIAELAHLAASEIEAGIYDRLRQFCARRPIEDDITYVIIKFTAEQDVSQLHNGSVR